MVFCVCRLTYTFMGKWVDKNTASDTKPLLNGYHGLTLTCIPPRLGLFFSILPVSLISHSGYWVFHNVCVMWANLPLAFKERQHSPGDGAWKWQTGEEGCTLSFISFLAVFNFSFALFKHNYFKPFSLLCCVKIYLLTST